jgi:hypothetical protein
MVIIAIGVAVYAVSWVRGGREAGQLVGGAWLVVYLVGITAFSAVGSFDGAGLVPAPWDSVAVAAFSLAVYAWGAAAGTAYMRARPEMVERLGAQADADRAS